MNADLDVSSGMPFEKIQTIARSRPRNRSEQKRQVKENVECSPKTCKVSFVTGMHDVGLAAAQQTKVYNFDKVFRPNSTQLEVYKNVVKSRLLDVLEGYNCTVLVYGQPGTGKKYTMEGKGRLHEYKNNNWDDDSEAGIIPRAINQLFDCLEKTGCEFHIGISMLEIYKEEIYDLLFHCSNKARTCDNSNKGPKVVSALTEIQIRDKSDIYDLLEQGAIKRRTVAASKLNKFLSRSHSLLQITVHTKDIVQHSTREEGLFKTGKLTLVKSGGNENIGSAGAVRERTEETMLVNLSSINLNNCFTALADKEAYVPYRESILTKLLQDSLGGATKTSIIATISPGIHNLDETLSTLEYAARAKNIHNRPQMNQKIIKRDPLKEHVGKTGHLQRDVVTFKRENMVPVHSQRYDAMNQLYKKFLTERKQGYSFNVNSVLNRNLHSTNEDFHEIWDQYAYSEVMNSSSDMEAEEEEFNERIQVVDQNGGDSGRLNIYNGTDEVYEATDEVYEATDEVYEVTDDLDQRIEEMQERLDMQKFEECLIMEEQFLCIKLIKNMAAVAYDEMKKQQLKDVPPTVAHGL